VASSTSKLVEASTTSAAKGSVTTAVPSALASVRRDEERISEVASGTNFMVKNNEYLPAADAMPAVRSAVRQRSCACALDLFRFFAAIRIWFLLRQNYHMPSQPAAAAQPASFLY